jgi:DNA-binding NtrC family response regulator
MNEFGERDLKIFMIEDDADLCDSWADLFAMLGHEFVCHQTGAGALKDLKSIQESDLVISDFYLPDVQGVELILQIRNINPRIQAILLTGSRDSKVLSAAEKLPDCTILQKPIAIEELEAQLERLNVA